MRTGKTKEVTGSSSPIVIVPTNQTNFQEEVEQFQTPDYLLRTLENRVFRKIVLPFAESICHTVSSLICCDGRGLVTEQKQAMADEAVISQLSVKLGIHMPVACTLAYQLLARASYCHVYTLTGMPVILAYWHTCS